MCRLLAWLGTPRTLAATVLESEFSLLRQSWAPRRQRNGVVNADGWGIAWWTPGITDPARWRSTHPMWQDAGASLGSVATHISSSCILASVRSATPGMPIDETATSPFVRGTWALAHNGGARRSMIPRGQQPPDSTCDSAILAAWLLDDPAELGWRIQEMGRLDPKAGLTCIAADGKQLVAATWGEPLFWNQDDAGITLASEPDDDNKTWIDVPDRHLILVDTVGVTMTPLEQP